jgi:phosphate transport system substrate-binding protein
MRIRIHLLRTALAASLAHAVLAVQAQTIEVQSSGAAQPLTLAIVAGFKAPTPEAARIMAGSAGSALALTRLCAGEAVIAVVSRPIAAAERAGCEAAGVAYVEVPVAFDAIVVVANPRNSFASALSDVELRSIWRADGGPAPARWRQVNPAFPDAALKLYTLDTKGEGTSTFDEAILGSGQSARRGVSVFGTENVLATAVARDANAIGLLPFVYFGAHGARLKAVPVSFGGSGSAVAPSRETVADGRYRFLSRPLFLYVRVEALERPEVAAFAEHYLQSAAAQAGYVPLTANSYTLALQRLRARGAGTLWDGKIPTGLTPQALEERLAGK